ncbi:MAG: hypothetical protein CMP23_15755 [Rickettsiales bacterium]|nr:hypothetical protein [Rickettsiales bacterium]|tara:strand:+ start:6324 stop:7463 length:1140 start_codon:yes stop_codon:yes gene_type:complete
MQAAVSLLNLGLVAAAMVLLYSCSSDVSQQPEPGAQLNGPGAYVIASDYADSVIGRVELPSGTVQQNLATFPNGDLILQQAGNDLFVLSRSGEDVVRRYPNADFSDLPDLEVALQAGANPHALSSCGGLLWLSLYNRSELIAMDPESGEIKQRVDLHSFDEGSDNSCEPSTLIQRGDRLLVALERFDLHSLRSDPQGLIIEFDCESGELTEQWSTGPNPKIVIDPRNPDHLLVKEGDFYQLDGRIRSLNLNSGEFGPSLLRDIELGGDLSDFVAVGDYLIASSWSHASSPESSSLHCLNRSQDLLIDGPAGLSQNLWHLGVSPTEQIWAGLTPSAANPAAEHGILRLDPASCEASDTELLSFLLPPTHFLFFNASESGP